MSSDLIKPEVMDILQAISLALRELLPDNY
jgi:hypothetical protein